MRGSPPRCSRLRGAVRSIPARAGEPDLPLRPSGNTRVYPRPCGGAPNRANMFARVLGLSPPVRGSHRNGDVDQKLLGSIPARAGEPRRKPPRGLYPRVYPRPCGGAASPSSKPDVSSGLSPPVRGSRCLAADHGDQQRSIPARAGEPRRHHARGRAPGVYPRPCGGASRSIRAKPSPDGLSPPVRGSPAYPDASAA